MIAGASSSSEIGFVPVVPRVRSPAAKGGAMTAVAGGAGGAPLVPLFTFVLWGGLLSVGMIGLLMEPAPVLRLAPAPPAVTAQLLAAELTSEPMLRSEPGSVPPPAGPPPLLPAMDEPPLPALTAVAAPAAAVAFSLSVETPVRIASAGQAGFSPAAETAPAATAASARVQPIVYGQGEGRQQAPEYPRQARRERQEGAVGVKFSVGRDGRVVEAALSSPSPWPLLNAAALQVIRERWRFAAGEARIFEVYIRFELKR